MSMEPPRKAAAMPLNVQERIYLGRQLVMAAPKLSEHLTDLGYPVNEMDVKNARRSQLNEGIAPDVPEVRLFLDRVKALFAGLEVERFIQTV